MVKCRIPVVLMVSGGDTFAAASRGVESTTSVIGILRCWPDALATLDHLQRNRTQKVLLADVEPVVAQDSVGNRQVKIEVRQREMVEIVVAFHLTLVGRSEREGELAVGGGIDFLRVERL